MLITYWYPYIFLSYFIKRGYTIFGKKEFEIFDGNFPSEPLKYNQNKDVCKKLQLKILKFERIAHIIVEIKFILEYF